MGIYDHFSYFAPKVKRSKYDKIEAMRTWQCSGLAMHRHEATTIDHMTHTPIVVKTSILICQTYTKLSMIQQIDLRSTSSLLHLT